MPILSGVPGGSCSIRLASPAHWMPKISAQRRCSSGPSAGTNGVPGTVALQAVHGLRQARTERVGTAARVTGPSSKLVVTRRSVSSLATSTSRVIQYESRRIGWPSPTRGDSASSRPFSAIRQWPPKTRSVVDSDGPQPAIA